MRPWSDTHRNTPETRAVRRSRRAGIWGKLISDVGIVFLAALILGLGTLALQLVLSSGDADGADGGDGDANDHDAHAHASPSELLPIFLSLRFWTFGALAFGLVGSLLHFLGVARPVVSLPLAIAMGAGCGFLASWTLQKLSRDEANSASDASSVVGQVGRVLIPCGKDRPGKIRIELKGQIHDFFATTDDAELEDGTYVLIEEMRGATAHVSRAPDVLAPKRES